MQATAPHYLIFTLPKLRKTLLWHYRRLSETSRRLRFMGKIKEDVLAKTANTSSPDVTFGVESDGAYRGILELYIIDAGRAEIGLSVEDAYQGRGIGRALFRRGLAEARARRLDTIDVHFLQSNQAIRKLCLEAGGDIRANGSECMSTIQL